MRAAGAVAGAAPMVMRGDRDGRGEWTYRMIFASLHAFTSVRVSVVEFAVCVDRRVRVRSTEHSAPPPRRSVGRVEHRSESSTPNGNAPKTYINV